MSAGTRALVFTDLDGSLLDHHSYSVDAALPMLERLERAAIPVIAVSSKTRVEIECIRAAIGNRHPFVVENGAAIYIPRAYFASLPEGALERGEYWVLEFSPGRQRWLRMLQSLEPDFAGEFEYFQRAGVAGIAAMTGLSAAEAALANQREFSEPVSWLGSEERKAQFVAALQSRGAQPLQGGRFLTLAGDCDKGRALARLRAIYAGQSDHVAIHDIAIGDSNNDTAMLEAAETALVIRSPVHDYPPLQREGGVIYSDGCGPLGWAEGVGQWLAESAPGASWQ
ncbi:HAD-IIB family hydrolase [Seongchinamella sediminis]|uniref:HAD-IIB family hydrolase n=1 Tax=Seongchinamella sediminis TaxID=2283635 RepID=A0A3L7E4Y9_9GAMM|nr:HAD-IIB family hydrolase [Seongchinamella sediminis]RLQ23661.1 HAD-IIB family hydrolase [Seongchinamella sediminis]